MRLGVIGLGLIGGSLALDLRGRGFASRAVGVESNAANAAQALELGLVDEVATLEDAVRGSDLVVLAVPVSAIARLLPQVLSLAPPSATVTDMGSTKRLICERVESHPARARFVASHPMAGTENSGPRAALRGLFDGKTAVVCDPERSDPASLERVEAMYGALGMRLIRMTSVEHDLHAAYVSHLSHISSFVLANTVLAKERDRSAIFDLAGGGFESTVRLAKSSPEMWAPIFEQNRANVVEALDGYLEHLLRFRRALAESDDPARGTKSLMEDANRIRPVLEKMGARRIGPRKQDKP